MDWITSRTCDAATAAEMIQDGDILGLSGFTLAGYPKAVPSALAARAQKLHEQGQHFKVDLFSGASTGDSCDVCQGDIIDPEQFLFIKAYALSVMESRSLTPVQIEDDGFDCSESSPIEKEVELLLFEM